MSTDREYIKSFIAAGAEVVSGPDWVMDLAAEKDYLNCAECGGLHITADCKEILGDGDQPGPLWTPHIYSIDDVDARYVTPLFLIDAERTRRKQQLVKALAELDAKEAEIKQRYEAAVQTFIFGMLPKNKKGEFAKKYVHTAMGTIKFTEKKETWVIDKKAALEWAKDGHPGMLVEKVTQDIYVDDARGYAQGWLATTGELMPWVSIEPARQVFSVKFTDKEDEDE